MAHVIVIPARLASERLPGKLLRDDTGWPLIRHVHARCQEVRGVDRVVVAVDGPELREAVEGFGGEAVLTDPALPTGTDRVAEAARVLGLDPGHDLVVNVQGDEPEIDPHNVEILFARLERSRGGNDGIGVATLATRREDPEGWLDPNRVKVVLDRRDRALYFSRAPLPRPRSGEPPEEWLLHVGIYGFLPGALARFRALDPSPLEGTERLEQLRFLEEGIGIGVEVVEEGPGGIDTEADYARFVSRFRESRAAARSKE
ncbi:MAG: 3-deoxy-manno-octulosonate cytidylyltransferase [Planctomycetota bacterium]|jgi:3-deoxy-manno-octulosonate cytidylyltransferase (CMP-KDO synthetase)